MIAQDLCLGAESLPWFYDHLYRRYPLGSKQEIRHSISMTIKYYPVKWCLTIEILSVDINVISG